MSQWQHLVISAVGLQTKKWLMEWRWLVPDSYTPLWLNAFGDWTFSSKDGEIWFLDLLEGSLVRLATSGDKLNELLQCEGNRNRWLMADWVTICEERGLRLAREQCYGWKTAPVLGGAMEFSNIQVFDMGVYQCIMGQVHRQLKKLPQGYVITNMQIGSQG